MPKFSETSQSKLATCDRRIHHVLHAAIGFTDFSVLCGHRGEVSQDKAFADGKSKRQWPDSLHNVQPSLAVDIAPYPIDWPDKEGVIQTLTYANESAIHGDDLVNEMTMTTTLRHIEDYAYSLGRFFRLAGVAGLTIVPLGFITPIFVFFTLSTASFI